MAKRTDGQKRLDAWFEADPARTRASLASKLGITPQAISMWLSDKNASTPAERLWPLIEAATGIPGVEFLTADEKRERQDRLDRLAALRATG